MTAKFSIAIYLPDDLLAALDGAVLKAKQAARASGAESPSRTSIIEQFIRDGLAAKDRDDR